MILELSNIVNHYILTCDSICNAVYQVHKLFVVQCGMRIELSDVVQFVNKNFVDHTISIVEVIIILLQLMYALV